MFNYAGGAADYAYGNAKYCYECHDGFYQVPAAGYAIATPAYDAGTADIAGVCKCTLILYASITPPSMRSQRC